jgi:hypothetical protein
MANAKVHGADLSRMNMAKNGWWFPVVSYGDPQNLGFMTWMIWATMT